MNDEIKKKIEIQVALLRDYLDSSDPSKLSPLLYLKLHDVANEIESIIK